MILSLQGCMAVGKTTAARYLEQHCQQVQVCFEDNAAVLAEIKQRGLNKNSYADYLEIQRLFLRNELRRGQEAKKYPHAMMDFGAEEIEFYTLNYPKSRGLDWDIEAIRQALAPELAAVQACMPERILFLDASEAVLRARKVGDTTRSREFFAYYLNHLLPLKREWFREKKNVTVLLTDGLTAAEVGECVVHYCKKALLQQEGQ